MTASRALSRMRVDALAAFRNEAYVVSKKLLSDSDPSSMRGRGRERDGPSLGDPGDHARRYYLQKLGIHPGDKEGRRALVRSYLEGLTWCTPAARLIVSGR
eukprot:3263851-Pleurochrysis_carterae.AAC.1